MEKAAEIFFEHFGLAPDGSREGIHRIAETFSAIPWENLTKFLLKASGQQRPRLAQEVMEGHALRGTGGTCYSLTETLGTIMSACGLRARPLTGHMAHGRNIHCALLVQGQAGSFLIDPGYVVPGAVPISKSGGGRLAAQGREMIWAPVSGGWELRTLENGEETLRYRLEDRALSREEFMGYWIRSFSATGLNGLHLNLSLPLGGRMSAHNGNLRVVEGGSRRNVKIAGSYAEAVSKRFGVEGSVAEAAWKELERQRRERV